MCSVERRCACRRASLVVTDGDVGRSTVARGVRGVPFTSSHRPARHTGWLSVQFRGHFSNQLGTGE
jgi:hypothetical protein